MARAIPTKWTPDHLAQLIRAHLDFLDENGTLINTWTQATWDNPALQEIGLAEQMHNHRAIGKELARLRGVADIDPTLEGIVFLGMVERLWYYAHSGGATIIDADMQKTLLIAAEGLLTRRPKHR
jgi:hypothetical protein